MGLPPRLRAALTIHLMASAWRRFVVSAPGTRYTEPPLRSGTVPMMGLALLMACTKTLTVQAGRGRR